jgi:hypothetical protein
LVAAVADRTRLWTPLLRRLGQTCPSCAVHGDVSEGFAGEGDVDVVAPERDLGVVEAEFRAWARSSGLGPTVACTHRPGVLVLAALAPAAGEPFFEVEARHTRYFRGRTLWRAPDLVDLVEEGDYRRLRPGAAGLLKLVPNGIRPGGRPKWSAAKRARVSQRLRADPEGARLAARLFGRARGAALRAADAVAAGGWDRRASLLLELWAASGAITEIPALARRVRARARPRCLVLDAVKGGRRVSGDREEWLTLVARDHPVDR